MQANIRYRVSNHLSCGSCGRTTPLSRAQPRSQHMHRHLGLGSRHYRSVCGQWLIAIYSGKGTPRRKVKKVHKSAGTDDKKLQGALKKLNVQPIQAIEEVNMFKTDGNVIHFSAPKGTSNCGQTRGMLRLPFACLSRISTFDKTP